MQRHRQVAAAPKRRASETWEAIEQLIIATLGRSPRITAGDVAAALEPARTVGRALVAAGHLDKHAVVVAADPVYLNITTVSGTGATNLDEDLGPVPGGAGATEWTIYLPTPDPVGDAVRSAVAGSSHLSADEPPGETTSKAAGPEQASVLNLDALARRAQERA
jgi:hypothetical protein